MPAVRALALVFVLVAVLAPASARAQDPCENPGNLTFNCQFDTFGPAPGGAVPTGWWPFVISGHPAFDQATDTPKQPSLRVWSDGEGFVAGVYQEVTGIQPGATYEAFIGWAVFQSQGDEMGRAIGIDPRGGTDPGAASVVWSPEVWEKKRGNPELRVRAVAEGDRLTVFARVNHPRSYGADEAFLDAVSLVRDESVPVGEVPVTEPEPTSTPVLTEVPVATDTPIPAPTLELEPTALPTDTSTPPPDPPTPTHTVEAEPEQGTEAASLVTPSFDPTVTAEPSPTPEPETATPTPLPSPATWTPMSTPVVLRLGPLATPSVVGTTERQSTSYLLWISAGVGIVGFTGIVYVVKSRR